MGYWRSSIEFYGGVYWVERVNYPESRSTEMFSFGTKEKAEAFIKEQKEYDKQNT